MEFIIGLGLGIIGYISNKSNTKNKIIDNNDNIKLFNKNYLTNYRNNIIDNANSTFYDNISSLNKKGI